MAHRASGGPLRKVLRNQGWHLLAYGVLGAVLYLVSEQLPEKTRRMWGLTASDWIVVSWIIAGVHQAYIAILGRLELYMGTMSAWFGDAAFSVFKLGFFTLGPTRLAMVVPISLATAGTLPIPRWASASLIIVTTPFILWTFYSFVAYFGLDRAACADHFDPAYRSGTLERRGIFGVVPHPGYTVGILIIYHAGLLWQSSLGLIAAVVHHAFVWCAYYSFEKPDMKEIYGTRAD